jgi:ATP-dependent RNA helicase RhlE
MLTVPRNPRALVVVQNRELTIQANAVFSMFKHDIKLKVDSIYRGQTARVENKILDQGTDILISTPDRIDKHLLARRIGFKHLEHIVIDELDTLIDSGFRDFIEEYFKLREVANMTMVAATVPPYLDKFIDTHFSAPDSPEPDRPAITKVIESKTHTNLANIAHEFIKLPEFNKMPTVLDVVRTINEDVGKGGGCMIFCNSI